MIKFFLDFIGGRELAKSSAPIFSLASGLAVLLNLALLPAESGPDVSSDFAQLLRAIVFVSIGIIGTFFFIRHVFFSRLAFGILLSYFVLFSCTNLFAGAITVNWLMFVVSIVISAFLINSAVSTSSLFKRLFVGSVEWVLIFWVGAFFFQQISYYVSGEIVELHKFFAPYSAQRTELLSSGLVRLGGAHIEPGTHANWIYGLVLLRAIYLRQLFDRLSIVSLLSVPLTMSFWGLISSFIFFIVYIVAQGQLNKSRIFLSVFFASALLAVLYYGGQLDAVFEYMQVRSQIQDESTEAKMAGIVGFFSNFHEYILIGAPHSYDFCSGCLSPQDIGVFFNTIAKVGFFFTVFLFFIFYRSLSKILGPGGVLFSIPLLFAKWFYWEPILWLVIFAAIVHAETRAKASR